jgi:hypothetical protein
MPLPIVPAPITEIPPDVVILLKFFSAPKGELFVNSFTGRVMKKLQANVGSSILLLNACLPAGNYRTYKSPAYAGTKVE